MNIGKCLICWWKLKSFLTWKDYRWQSSDKIYTLYKCDSCRLEIINPLPSIDEQELLYPKNYYSYNIKQETKQTIKQRILNFLNRITNIFYPKEYLLNKDFGKHKNFLDIWCGDGFNIEKMSKKWYNAEGFEISKEKKYVNKIYYWPDIINIDFKKKFDIINISHVREHIPNPNEVMKKLYTIIDKDGIIIIKVPNVDCISAKLFGKYAAERDIPRHLYNYNMDNLCKLFTNNKYKVIKKSILPQNCLLLSLDWALQDKYNMHITNKRYYNILWLFFYLVELLFTITRNTNQIGIIIKKI